MTIYANFDDGRQEMLATTFGWGEFSRWADGLDEGAFPEVVHLAEHGWEQELEALERQLGKALQGDVPDTDVAATGKALLEIVGQRGEAEALVISDGMTPAGPDVLSNGHHGGRFR